MAKVYVDFAEFPKDENGEIYVYRYEPVEYFKGNIENERLMFSSLRNWDDRLEIRYEKYGKNKTGKTPVGLCFTTDAKHNSAAAWGMHKGLQRKTYVQIKYSLKNLIKGLEFFAKDDVVFYVKKVQYKDAKDITKLQSDLAENLSDEKFVDLLCQKRYDFEFEGEIRIIALGKDLLKGRRKMYEVYMGKYLKDAVCGLKLEPFSVKDVRDKNVQKSRDKDTAVQDLLRFVKEKKLNYAKKYKSKKDEWHIVKRSRLYEYGPEYSGGKSKKSENKSNTPQRGRK